MRYFLLKQEPDETNVPNLDNWYSQIPPPKLRPEKAHTLPNRFLINLVSSDFCVFTDAVLSPFLLLSQTLRDVVAFYEPKLPFKDIVLLDRKTRKSALYYLPILDSVDCLAEGTVYNLNKSALKHAVIEPEKAKGRSIFRIGGVLNTYIVVRLDLAESALRRGVRGLSMEPLACVQKQEEDARCRERNFWSGARR